jgi:hypothetical protein
LLGGDLVVGDFRAVGSSGGCHWRGRFANGAEIGLTPAHFAGEVTVCGGRVRLPGGLQDESGRAAIV